ncbi:flagellar hook-basal body complex protein [Pseudooceanicola sp. CBS1P-1]|uniref:Flagellar basal-body rod protein FlgF n=1 Tax=Pseudooceanicola albus TaxID=2692189 RepID=A0A6L7G979_9RHOB|nr:MULTISPECIES: flagellar hook-basal body complex protein [Pseudooceanicola]MBT9385857.1 flagellar hook-basal body complex protein [Pseudooceanicola endophyticus]MXN20088.1 flagellar hook-basal body complex protein [Pseudooceanicola albus]
MENAGYTTLARLSGLMREMTVIANNIANANTTGFRQEDLIFSEYIAPVDDGPSLSMAEANLQWINYAQGTLEQTGGPLDFAIEGDGYFVIQTPNGDRLTRAGSFASSNAGDLVTNDGYPVLDSGGAPVFVPPDVDVSVGADGTLSANGQAIGQIGIVRPLDPLALVREGGVMFRADAGTEPVEDPRVLQGFLEASNVDPIGQVARMVEVQRAYELGQSFLDKEDERIRTSLQTLLK